MKINLVEATIGLYKNDPDKLEELKRLLMTRLKSTLNALDKVDDAIMEAMGYE